MCVCVCVYYWPPVCKVFINHEVVMFQPRIVTTPKSRFCHLLLYSLLLNTTRSLLLQPDVLPGGKPTPDLAPNPPMSGLSLYGIICPPGHHPSPSQHTKNTSPPFPPPRLPYYRRCCSLAATKISSNVSLRFFSAANCRHHGSRSLPPPS